MHTSMDIRVVAHTGVSEMRDRNQDVPKAYSPFQMGLPESAGASYPLADAFSDAAADLPRLTLHCFLDIFQGYRAALHAVALLDRAGLGH